MSLQFDLAAVKKCIECRGCEHDCPSFKVVEGYNPTVVLKDILAGRAESWVNSPMIWQCLECHTCSERCPQKYSWETVMTALKKEAVNQGLMPEPVAKGWQMFVKTGRLGDPRLPARRKYGLPEPRALGLGDLKRLFPDIIR